MRLLSACLLGAVALVATASGAEGPDWKKLKYFHYDLYELALGSNGSWTNADTIPKASEGYVPRYLLPSWARTRGEAANAIWAETCKKGRQVVSLTRSFYAPGAATPELQAGGVMTKVVGQLGYSAGVDSAIKQVRVLLNGVLIAKAGAYRSGSNQIGAKPGDAAPLAAAGKAFKFGSNVLTIRATKGPNAGKCGISFALVAEFAANVQLGRTHEDAKKAAVPRYAKVEPGASVAGKVVGTVRNDGPATSLSGTLTVSVGGDFVLRGANLAANGFDCGGTVLDPPQGRGVTFDCPWIDFGADERKSVSVTFSGRVTEAVNYDEKNIVVGFQLGYRHRGGRAVDRGPPVTGLNVTFVACGPTADDEGCKNPKGWG